MKIMILQGSPRLDGKTAVMCGAFAKGAREAGHDVTTFDVARMKIEGCRGCLACHAADGRTDVESSLAPAYGDCVMRDDMDQIYALWHEADVMVWASPIYYGSPTPDILKVLHRSLPKYVPAKVTKTALFLASGAPDVYYAAQYIYYGYIQGYFDAEDLGVFTCNDATDIEKLREELQALGASLEPYVEVRNRENDSSKILP